MNYTNRISLISLGKYSSRYTRRVIRVDEGGEYINYNGRKGYLYNDSKDIRTVDYFVAGQAAK